MSLNVVPLRVKKTITRRSQMGGVHGADRQRKRQTAHSWVIVTKVIIAGNPRFVAILKHDISRQRDVRSSQLP